MKLAGLMALMALMGCDPQLPACVQDCTMVIGGGDRGDIIVEAYP